MASRNRIFGFLLFLTVLGLAVPACSLKKRPPDILYYVLETERAPRTNGSTGTTILGVREFQVAPMFERSGFVYRKSEVRYESDFYHQFLIPPAKQLTVAARTWFSGSNLFSQVVDSVSTAGLTHLLEGRVNALYADYRDRKSPRAVLEIDFLVVADPLGSPRLMFHRDYRESIPFESGDTESMVTAWSGGLKNILAGLEGDLAGLGFNGSAKP